MTAPTHRRLTAEDQLEILRLHKEGLSGLQIGRLMGIAASSTYRFLERFNAQEPERVPSTTISMRDMVVMPNGSLWWADVPRTCGRCNGRLMVRPPAEENGWLSCLLCADEPFTVRP